MSYVILTSSHVEMLCRCKIAYADAYKKSYIETRVKEKRDTLLRQRAEFDTKWYNKLLGRTLGDKPMPSDEELLEVGGRLLVDLRYQQHANTAKRLLLAAKTSDTVYVSTRDLESIS